MILDSVQVQLSIDKTVNKVTLKFCSLISLILDSGCVAFQGSSKPYLSVPDTNRYRVKWMTRMMKQQHNSVLNKLKRISSFHPRVKPPRLKNPYELELEMLFVEFVQPFDVESDP